MIMITETTSISCGVQQIYNLIHNNLAQDFWNLLHNKYKNRIADIEERNQWQGRKQSTKEEDVFLKTGFLPAHYVFSDADKYKNGTRFEKFITDNALGALVKADSALNKNSGNEITTWIWVTDKEAIFKWFLAHRTVTGDWKENPDDPEPSKEELIYNKTLVAYKLYTNGCKCKDCTRHLNQSKEELVKAWEEWNKVREAAGQKPIKSPIKGE